MELLKMRPAFKDYLWGGRRLVTRFHKKYSGERLAESWELSCHPDGESHIDGGPFDGQSLPALLCTHGEIAGSNTQKYEDFPILIKLIDAKEPLSIQVHPDDAYARQHEGQNGKTEVWYVVDCDPGAFIYYGFKEKISRDEFRRRIEDQTLTEVLNKVPVHPGGVYFIPAGTLHAIGAGLLVAEIQQNSNVTYRIYDYGRKGADGKTRELHIDKALDVTLRTPMPLAQPAGNPIAQSDYFSVDVLDVDGEWSGETDGTTFHHFLVLSGSGGIQNAGSNIPLEKGNSVLVSANAGDYQIKGVMRLIKTIVP